jgi:SAM-dependent methyltransferase
MNLNLGAGGQTLPGFHSVDLAGADFLHDLSRRPWPFVDGSVSAIVASHILEHFDKHEGRLFLRECYRILAPGGILAIAVPDMDKFITAHLTGDFAPLGGYRWTNLNNLCGGGALEPNPAQRHRYMYAWESLAYALTAEGFTPEAVPFDGSVLGAVHTDAYRAISLYVDARKP